MMMDLGVKVVRGKEASLGEEGGIASVQSLLNVSHRMVCCGCAVCILEDTRHNVVEGGSCTEAR